MTPVHFLHIYQAETERLFRRMTAIVGLVLSVLFGLAGPGLMLTLNLAAWYSYQSLAEGQNPDDLIPFEIIGSWDYSLSISYYLRNFMFLPILIFLLGGLSMASEFVGRTVREDVLRPVPRWSLVLSKWLALLTWIIVASLALACLSAGLGLLVTWGASATPTAWEELEGLSGWDWFSAWMSAYWTTIKPSLIQVGVTFATDVGFASLALAVAVVTRSVAATVAGLVMVFMVQLAVAIGFGVLGTDMARQFGPQIASQWVPNDAWETIYQWIDFFAKWQPPFVLGTCPFSDLTPESFITLSFITLASLATALFVFERMDVP